MAGNFTLDVPTWQSQVNLWAKDQAGSRIGSLHYVPDKAHQPAPDRACTRPVRFRSRVVDGKGTTDRRAQKSESTFEEIGMGVLFVDRTRQKLVGEQTDAKGQAVLHLPPGVPLEAVWAVKAGAGFDYVLYRSAARSETQRGQQPPADPAMRAQDDSRPISFVFGGVQKAAGACHERAAPAHCRAMRICMRVTWNGPIEATA